MIVLLLSCSTSWCQSNIQNKQDSVFIAIDALRTANAKMVELEYTKQVNEELNFLVKKDSELINALQLNLNSCETTCVDKVDNMKKQRNIAIGAGSGTAAFLLILLLIIAL